MARGKAKRDALTASAAELFWQKGFAATSIADISALSKVPLGNIYYYFRSKSDFAMAVADVFVAETEGMLNAIESEEKDPRRRLALLVSRLARTLKSRVAYGCPIALCVRDFRRDAPEAAERAGEAFSLLVGFIARRTRPDGPASVGRAGDRARCGRGMAGRHDAGPCAAGIRPCCRRAFAGWRPAWSPAAADDTVGIGTSG